ncbi:hypothetical protein AXA44_19050 [Rhodococcus sp. SC4]|uniref:hypothetical protein n=1 Tax=Rhodococcus sp. LB1 TaxID=1807499 RepID=UPI00076A8889|nr:hypothetical protein [Rhodococcus sp. LB1]KXF50473.1 hypothetical protein AXA44_19050 [Rhodococcus sp. SC4]KXX54689.1 hypothetical protein AZG88_23235 [Rhodococcus sp. LB1]
MPDAALTQLLSDAIAKADPEIDPGLDHDPAAYLALVRLTSQARESVDELLVSAIAAARSAGHSWDTVGAALGMSRQAAQQRFGKRIGDAPDADPDGRTRRLTPLTAFNEMHILNHAGTYGWHSVGFGTLFHTVRKSEEQWEHTRVSAPASRQKLEADGWQKVGTLWFPWAYFKRPLGIPALPEPVSGDYLMEP